MEQQFSRKKCFRLGLLLTGGVISSSVLAAGADYIAAIEADVAEFTTHEFQAPADSGWIGAGDEAAQGAGSQSMDLDGFSASLRKKTPGSFIFYKKLPMEYQRKLHDEYLSTGDLDRIKEDIFKYTREVRRD
jgi:hypothetical protein